MDAYYSKLIDSAKRTLDILDISYAPYIYFSTDRAKTRYGQATHLGGLRYKITISENLLATKNDTEIITTLIHELLHTCKGGMCHTGEWKRLADYVTDMTAYTITRTSHYEDVMENVTRMSKKFTIVCEECNSKWEYARETKIVKLLKNNSKSCVCPNCKGHNFKVYDMKGVAHV